MHTFFFGYNKYVALIPFQMANVSERSSHWKKSTSAIKNRC